MRGQTSPYAVAIPLLQSATSHRILVVLGMALCAGRDAQMGLGLLESPWEAGPAVIRGIEGYVESASSHTASSLVKIVGTVAVSLGPAAFAFAGMGPTVRLDKTAGG